MGRAALGCVLLALVAAPAVYAMARRAPAVTVCVDGANVGPTDGTTGAPLNVFVVEGVPVAPVRLFTAALDDGLDLYLWRWRVVQLTPAARAWLPPGSETRSPPLQCLRRQGAGGGRSIFPSPRGSSITTSMCPRCRC